MNYQPAVRQLALRNICIIEDKEKERVSRRGKILSFSTNCRAFRGRLHGRHQAQLH